MKRMETHHRREFGDHMPTELDLEIREATLVVRGSERAHTAHDEAVIRDRRSEALLAVPCTTTSTLLSRSFSKTSLPLTSHAAITPAHRQITPNSHLPQ